MKTLRFQLSDFDAACEAVREQINPRIPFMSVVIDWNDDPSRTYEEVTALLEAAILRQREIRHAASNPTD